MAHHNPEQALGAVRREFGEHGGVTPSISRSSSFTVMDPGIMPEIFQGRRTPHKDGCYLYSRHFNPTVHVLDRYLAAMEGSEAALSTASGMAAISTTLLQLCQNGDHIVASNTIYGGTHALLKSLLPEMGVTTTFVDPTHPAHFENACTPATKVFYTETLGNPTLNVANIPRLADAARRIQVKLVVDNTFTPMVVSPAVLGADIVVHSMTKYINGASDAIAGAICADQAFVLRLADLHTGRVMLLGPTIDPRVAFDIIQRLPHLAIRMREHSRRALAAAELLHQLGTKVIYPGLEGHPQHRIFKTMHNDGYGFGGMLAVDCGTKEAADKLLSRLQNTEQFGLMAVSLGFYDTLMSCSGTTTSSEMSTEDQQKIGLSPGLVRISMGYTGDLEERLHQLERAVRSV